MAEYFPTSFSSADAFGDFARKVRQGQRHFFDQDVSEFLRAVAESASRRERTIDSSSVIYRAREGCRWRPMYDIVEEHGEYIEVGDEPYPFDEMGLRPFKDKAPDQRANPKGVPVFYGSADVRTAASEIRAGVGAFISIGAFRPNRLLRLVGCNTTPPGENIPFFFGEGPPSEDEIEAEVWRDIDRAFSRPVQRNDDVAEYAGTQILAELFKSRGYDGLIFRSSVAKNLNIVLFDPRVVDLKAARVVSVRQVIVEICEETQWFQMDASSSAKPLPSRPN